MDRQILVVTAVNGWTEDPQPKFVDRRDFLGGEELTKISFAVFLSNVERINDFIQLNNSHFNVNFTDVVML